MAIIYKSLKDGRTKVFLKQRIYDGFEIYSVDPSRHGIKELKEKGYTVPEIIEIKRAYRLQETKDAYVNVDYS